MSKIQQLIAFAIVLSWGTATFAQPPDSDQADALASPVAAIEFSQETRVPVSFKNGSGGIEVVALDKGFPKLEFFRNDPTRGNLTGFLEVGDVITQVDGQPSPSIYELFYVMKRGGPQFRFRVRDKNNGSEHEWFANPRAVTVPRIVKPTSAPTGSRLFVVHVVATNDAQIGEQISKSIPRIKTLVESAVVKDRLANFTVLSGNDCSAEKLLSTLADLSLTAADSLMVYYQGHGGFDPRFEGNDCSAGHFLDFGGVDLLRSDLLKAMVAKRARMTLLVTDCCNDEATMTTDERPVSSKALLRIEGWTQFEELVFCHCGLVDITAVSRGNKSWCTNSVGSWFTHCLVNELGDHSKKGRSWSTVWDSIKNRSEEYYQQKREKYKDRVEELRLQTNMPGHEYIFDAQRQNPPDPPVEIRMIPRTVSREVQGPSQ